MHSSSKSVVKRLAASLLLTACAWVQIAEAGEVTPESLIGDMAVALTTLNYEGNFVHLQNGNVESMSIVHSFDDTGELEYMLSLNGEAREVFRDKSLVMCIWPSSESVIVSDSKSRKLLPHVDASLTDKEHYSLTMGKADRVAGKEVHVVSVMPKDEFRYGYRFWIDKSNNMLLRSMLMDNQENSIEQVMFTNIEYPESISLDRFDKPDDKIKGFSTTEAFPTIRKKAEKLVDFETLPAGYEEVSSNFQPRPENDGPMTHVMLSDGMASVSVYVEHISKSAQEDVALGMSTMGAMNAYTRSLEKALITVVGEVPSATVESIAQNVRLLE